MSGKRYTAPSKRPAATTSTPSWRTIQLASFVIQLCLIAYGEYHDRRNVVKYTDVDYRVFSDAVRALWVPDEPRGNVARGVLMRSFGWTVGDPYTRATYRYTPLLAVLLSPIHVLPAPLGPISGKVVFSYVSSFTIPNLLARLAAAEGQATMTTTTMTTTTTATTAWLIHGIWTLNPMILNINTRGSSEALLVVLVLGSLVALREGRWRTCAVLWGMAIHWKLYPVIHASSILVVLQRQDGGVFWTRRKLAFGLCSVGTMVALSGCCWLIWGQPFLEHAFLYHATRLDHRHNFSPFFYPIYLQMFTPGSTTTTSSGLYAAMDRAIRHPLAAFLPQFSLALGTGFVLPPAGASVTFTWFVQTVAFVTFNKVCTSQYFIWYLFFLPIVIPQLTMSRTHAVACLVVWIASQAVWLAIAYQLEFLAQSVFLPLWVASLVFLAGNTWCLGVLLDGYRVGKIKGE